MLKPDARLSFDYFARSLNRLEGFASGIAGHGEPTFGMAS
jgi:hypothetical protein